MDVLLERHRVAVIELQPERLGVKVIGVGCAGRDLLERAIGGCAVYPVKMDRVRMEALVGEVHPDPVSLGGAQRGARDLAVVGPGREEHTGCHLDLTVLSHDVVLAEGLSGGEGRDFSVVEITQVGGGIKPARGDVAHAGHRVVHRRGVGLLTRPGAGSLERDGGAAGGKAHPAERCGTQQSPPRQAGARKLGEPGESLAAHASSTVQSSAAASSCPTTWVALSVSSVMGPRNGRRSRNVT